MSQNELPESIGKYKIESVLGKGAMGLVYRAFDSSIDRIVALKVLHAHLLEGEQGSDFKQRFIQEAKAAARCLHPNIVTIFDFGMHGTTPFIVMEYVEGIELKDRLTQVDARFSFKSALEIIIQILEALAYAHDQGVVHRDIKPANIMLMANEQVKVSDFGVARLDNSDLTSTGMMVGTPNYMSPEGMHGLQVDNRSDLYSVGVLLFELLTNQRPYKGISLEEAILPLSESNQLAELEKTQIKPILIKALQAKPELRFQQATEFISQLKYILPEASSEDKTVFHRPVKPVDQETAKHNIIETTSPSAPSMTEIHAESLSLLESKLIQYIGPAAKVLIKRYSQKSNSLEGLSISLAQQIPNKEERSEFLKTLNSTGFHNTSSIIAVSQDRSTLQATLVTQQTKNNDAPILTLEELQLITNELAFYIGPLASRFVKKAFKQSSSIEEFHHKVAKFIPDEDEQVAFLKKVTSQ